MVLCSASRLGWGVRAPLIYLPRGGRAKSRTEFTGCVSHWDVRRGYKPDQKGNEGSGTPGFGTNAVILHLLSEYPGTIGVLPVWRGL